MAVDNNVSIAGNLVADPELRYTKGGAAISSLRVAVNRRWNKNGEWEEETSFFDVTAWAQIAENCAETLTKGMRVVVTGRLEEQRWEDKETQEPRRKIVIIADEVTPSLRWATAEVTKQHGKGGGGQKASAPASGPVTEEEPF
jgi:single-strand DNA-binding protein